MSKVTTNQVDVNAFLPAFEVTHDAGVVDQNVDLVRFEVIGGARPKPQIEIRQFEHSGQSGRSRPYGYGFESRCSS